MLIDSVVINLTRKGFDNNPSYSLTIHGHGTLNYNGINNVKVKNQVEENIERDKIISLLSEFKNLGFFSIQDVYYVDTNAGRPFTTVSISIPDSNGQMKTKSLSHYDYEDVPNELKKIENKIDEVTNSEKWVKIPPKAEHEPKSEERERVVTFGADEEKKTSSSKIEEAKKFMDRMERKR